MLVIESIDCFIKNLLLMALANILRSRKAPNFFPSGYGHPVKETDE